MFRIGLPAVALIATVFLPQIASAARSGELYTSESFGYGRFEARIRWAPGGGVISSFFLWKDGSEMPGTFWNELDFEKVGASCILDSNAIYGNPSSNHVRKHEFAFNVCDSYHTYVYEWTADAIVWLVDGMEVRRETGEAAMAFAQNATAMQLRFNVWPGDASFGGTFDPSIVPVHQYIDWVQYSAFEGGAFVLKWRDDFDGTALDPRWSLATWASPKNQSTHDPMNVNLLNGYAVISLTADDALGPAGAMPGEGGGSGGAGTGGAGTAGNAAGGAPPASGGNGSLASGGTTNPTGGTAAATGGSPGSGGSVAMGGSMSTPGTGAGGVRPATGGTPGTGAAPSGVGGAPSANPTGGTPGAVTGGVTGSPDPGPSPPTTKSTEGGCTLTASARCSGATWAVLSVAFAAAFGRRRLRSNKHRPA